MSYADELASQNGSRARKLNLWEKIVFVNNGRRESVAARTTNWYPLPVGTRRGAWPAPSHLAGTESEVGPGTSTRCILIGCQAFEGEG